MPAGSNHDTATVTDGWLTLKEACDHVRLSERTLRDAINRPNAEFPLSATRIGNRIRIRVSELDAWMAAQS